MLHGLGGDGGVFAATAEHWPGRWFAPDLPGHGGSAWLHSYTFGAMAGELAGAVAEELPDDRPVAVLGHSLGGVLALTMASGWFGVPVGAVCGLGIKIRWSDEDLARARDLGARPPQLFEDRDSAMTRALRVTGLTDLLDGAATAVEGLVCQGGNGWRLCLDPKAFAVGAPDLPGLLAASRAEVVLAAGEKDDMCPVEHMEALGVDHVVLPGLGHNAHVEDPAALAPLLARMAAKLG
jgi:pimeloyl-ACP methyl ester carboxylesterase